jgi:hypothetical protein
MTMMKILSGALLASAIVSTGCLSERAYMDPNAQNLQLGGGVSSNIDVRDGTLRGDFGPRTGFNGPATRLDGYDDREYGYTSVTVTQTNPSRGTGMMIINVDGASLRDLEAGTHTFDYDSGSLDGANIMVNACSGPSDDSIDYDVPANEGTVVIQDTAQGRIVNVETSTDVVDTGTGLYTGQQETAQAGFTLVGR